MADHLIKSGKKPTTIIVSHSHYRTMPMPSEGSAPTASEMEGFVYEDDSVTHFIYKGYKMKVEVDSSKSIYLNVVERRSWLWYVTANAYLPLLLLDIAFVTICGLQKDVSHDLFVGLCIFYSIVAAVLIYFGMYRAYKNYVKNNS